MCNQYNYGFNGKYNNGTIGDLVLGTENLFSFGLQENVDMNTGNVNGEGLR